ncbi:KilA-N domain-containing protein [Klebsiella michiganensis]|uniref:KilA-N domain-containing protein n=2 Tax=Klebsiella/Raoultella group TaxID=2890311 RepID=A0A2J4YVJ7_9ENTR|nr:MULTISPECIES: KilA-N domain-containing protein [Klebsiella]QLP11010.1 KilA-N domain-containing protein [Klebsiella grimontii]QLT67589.1 KilA-N domain-containing protein [Klebsiella oxytoca]MBQ4656601.1 KilA-N domain-containing protein [Klebsiella michiganensis]MBQ4662356.1 KilA-N domain-containing protein [Klebsiella michiganensis]MBZ7134435.1 KilA-N domain-containing protein [Klebsiella michiganensis]
MCRCIFNRPDIIHLLFNTNSLSLLSCLTGLVSNDAFPSLGEKATAGRFNLNALHKASGGRDAKRPKAWLTTKQAQELIDELRQDSAFGEDVIKITKGGIAPGTFAHELLAIEYAGWISSRLSTSISMLKRRWY